MMAAASGGQPRFLPCHLAGPRLAPLSPGGHPDAPQVRPARRRRVGRRSRSCPLPPSSSTGRTNRIGRANLDGTGVNQSFITGVSSPTGVAVDAGHVYWANVAADTIGRANLDGTGVNQSFITGAGGPCGVAVDAGHIYWANCDDRARSAAPTSTAPAPTRASSPAPVNPVGRRGRRPPHLLGELRRPARSAAPTSTAPASTRASSPAPTAPGGVAVDAGHIYWANSYAGHDRPRQPRRLGRQPELHHRRQLRGRTSRSTPATSTGRRRPANVDGTG